MRNLRWICIIVKIGLEISASGRFEVPLVQNKMTVLIWFGQVQRRLLTVPVRR